MEGGSELLTYLPVDDHGSEMMLRLRIPSLYNLLEESFSICFTTRLLSRNANLNEA